MDNFNRFALSQSVLSQSPENLLSLSVRRPRPQEGSGFSHVCFDGIPGFKSLVEHMGYTLTVKNRLHSVWDNGSLIGSFEVVVKTATVVLRSDANLKAKTFCSALTTTTPDGVIVHTGTTTIPVPFELASDILPPLVTHLLSYGFRLKQDASGATNNSYWKVEAWKQWKTKPRFSPNGAGLHLYTGRSGSGPRFVVDGPAMTRAGISRLIYDFVSNSLDDAASPVASQDDEFAIEGDDLLDGPSNDFEESLPEPPAPPPRNSQACASDRSKPVAPGSTCDQSRLEAEAAAHQQQQTPASIVASDLDDSWQSQQHHQEEPNQQRQAHMGSVADDSDASWQPRHQQQQQKDGLETGDLDNSWQPREQEQNWQAAAQWQKQHQHQYWQAANQWQQQQQQTQPNHDPWQQPNRDQRQQQGNDQAEGQTWWQRDQQQQQREWQWQQQRGWQWQQHQQPWEGAHSAPLPPPTPPPE